jgi:CRISPR/Cas system-associated endoribonuclease Cas2
MSFYLISYDLRKPDYDYEPLYDELKKLKATRVQKSVWVLCSNQSAEQIRGLLWDEMDSDMDRILVAEMSGDYASHNAIKKIKPLRDACR